MKGIIIAAIVLCAGLIGLGYYVATKPDAAASGPRLVPVDASYTNRVKDGGWVKGGSSAKVKVIEYGDLQCPACRAVEPYIDQALQQTQDLVQFTYREYPLTIHNKSRQAAAAAEAAGRQGKFWEMKQLLYDQQPSWEEQTTFAFPQTLEQYASQLGLNAEQFKRDLNDPSIQEEVDKDIKAGDQIPVQGTPTILINDKPINPPGSADELVKIIRDAAGNVSSQ